RCNCSAVVLPAQAVARPKLVRAGKNRVQVNPLRRQKLARLRSRTTTKFRFRFFVGEPVSFPGTTASSPTGFHELHRSVHRAQHAADRRAGAVAQTPTGFQGTGANPGRETD